MTMLLIDFLAFISWRFYLNNPQPFAPTGVYVDDNEVKNALREKYGKLSSSELKKCQDFKDELMEGDIPMSVRLQIVDSELSIRSVRNAFEPRL